MEALPSGGESAAPVEFSSSYAIHLNQVFRQLRAMGVPERYLDDATQEVFLIAQRKLDEFEHRAQMSTWLYAIAYRVGSNFRRKAHRDPIQELVETDHESAIHNPERALMDKRAAAFVQKFCDELSEKLRDVFVLCLLEERPAAEVASILEITENTVYSRVRLVREAFRKSLAQSRGAIS